MQQDVEVMSYDKFVGCLRNNVTTRNGEGTDKRPAEAKLGAAGSKGRAAMDPLHLVSPGNNQSWLKFDLEEFT